MRFCPFCSAENVREATHCQACARRLPPLAPRRPRPATGEPPAAEEGRRADGEDRGAVAESSLESISLGPATRRARAPISEPPPAGAPARRAGDARPRRGSIPPLPNRVERDRAAGVSSARSPSSPGASLALPLPSRGGAAPASSPTPEPRPPSPAPEDREPSPAEDAEVASEPTARDDDEHDGELSAGDGPEPAGEGELSAGDGPEPAGGGEAGDDASPSEDDSEPPPTRLGLEVGGDRHVAIPSVMAIPETPSPGLWSGARYATQFARARLQRRRAIRVLRAEIRDDTASLDEELGKLGRGVRELGVDSAPLRDENRAIDEAEARREEADRACATLMSQQAEEKAKFAEVEAEKQAKVSEAESALDRAQRELASLEAQRRGLRDKRKTVERQQKGYLKAADDRDAQAAKAELQQARDALRRGASDLRRDAAGLEPELRDIERRLAALDTPIGEASARVDALKAELESVRRSLGDARDGHRHRLAELEGEESRKGRELSQAEAEIQRRLVTLGTLVNLNRIDRPELGDLYARIDGLRTAIGVRSRTIDQLTAESEAYDRGSLVRGVLALAGGGALFVTMLLILWAILV